MIDFISKGDILTADNLSQPYIIDSIKLVEDYEYLIETTNRLKFSYSIQYKIWYLLVDPGWKKIDNVNLFKQLDENFIRDIKISKLLDNG